MATLIAAGVLTARPHPVRDSAAAAGVASIRVPDPGGNRVVQVSGIVFSFPAAPTAGYLRVVEDPDGLAVETLRAFITEGGPGEIRAAFVADGDVLVELGNAEPTITPELTIIVSAGVGR